MLVWICTPLALIPTLGYAFRLIGFLRFETELSRLAEESPPSEIRASVDPGKNAALPFWDLERLVASGKARFDPDLEEPDPLDGALVAALAAFGRARDFGDMPYDVALDRAIEEILRERVPSPEAWTIVESWLPKLDEAFLSIDRICERPEWRFDRSDGALGLGGEVLRTMNLLNDVVPWVSVAAVHAARRGELALALRRLRQSFHLSRATREEPSSPCFIGFVHHVTFALGGLRQILQALPPEADAAWITQEIAGMDARARLRRAVSGDRQMSLELYRKGQAKALYLHSLLGQVSSRSSGSGSRPEWSPATRAWLHPLVAGHDAARFVELSAEVLGWLDASLADTLRLVERLAEHWGESPWHAPSAAYFASLLTMGVAACVDLESELLLAKIALTDREKGRAAALELLDQTLDPAEDQPLGQREEDDGTLTLWCIGSDLVDMEGSPGEGDIVWILPARR